MNHEHVLLGIDTSLSTSVALSATGGPAHDCGAAAAHPDPRGHAEHIGPLLAEVFSMIGILPDQVTGVVAGIGPGPFTGLRVGIAAAQAFALARNVPLLPLSGHEAVAFDALRAGGSRERSAFEDPTGAATAAAHGAKRGVVDRVRVVQDAKRRELFVTEYAGIDRDGLPVQVDPPHLVARADYVEQPYDVWPEEIHAELLLSLAERRLAAGRGFEPDRALYLRQPDVKQPGAPKRVSA